MEAFPVVIIFFCLLFLGTLGIAVKRDTQEQGSLALEFLRKVKTGVLLIQDGKVSYVNPIALSILNLEANQILHSSIPELSSIDPDSVENTQTLWNNFSRSAQQTGIQEFYWSFLSGNHSELKLQVSLYHLSRSRQFLALHQPSPKWDNTEELPNFEQIIATLPKGALLIDLDHKARIYNQAYCDLFNLAPVNPGEIQVDLGLLDHQKEKRRQMWDRLHSGNSSQDTFQFQIEDNTDIFLRSLSYPIRDEQGSLRFFLFILEDITEKVQEDSRSEEIQNELIQLDHLQSQRRFAKGLTSEFNNSLVPILGYSKLALEVLNQNDKVSLDDYLRKILDHSTKLSERVSDLQTTSMESPFDKQAITIQNLISRLEEQIPKWVPSKVRVKFLSQVEKGELDIDVQRILNVLHNLITNAYQAFGGSKLAQIQITAQTREINQLKVAFPVNIEPGKYFIIEILDNGQGVSSVEMKHIFDPYYSTRSSIEGTGLGLSVCLSTILEHGGFMQFESEIYKGTRVSVYLPFSIDPD